MREVKFSFELVRGGKLHWVREGEGGETVIVHINGVDSCGIVCPGFVTFPGGLCKVTRSLPFSMKHECGLAATYQKARCGMGLKVEGTFILFRVEN